MGKSVLSIRIDEELKRRMKRYADRVDWSREISEFIRRRVSELIREERLREVNRILGKHPELRDVSAAELVREDRDSH